MENNKYNFYNKKQRATRVKNYLQGKQQEQRFARTPIYKVQNEGSKNEENKNGDNKKRLP